MLAIRDDSFLVVMTVEDPISKCNESCGGGVSIYPLLNSGIRIWFKIACVFVFWS